MKFCFTLLAFFIAITGIKAQNIVPNSSFALHDTCPSSTSQVRRCTGWRPLTSTTPDYHHTCATDPNASVPTNFGGYQPSPSGSYMGMYTYNAYGSWHEYIATDIPALVAGSSYRVSIKISLGEGHSQFATEAPGVYFYKNAIPDSTNNWYLVLTPQVSYASYGVIYDTNWVVLSHTFTADSAYTHLGIGNFETDPATNKDSVGYGNGRVAYYYIDSVAVEHVSGVSEVSAHTAALYPNPVTGNAVLSFANPGGQTHSLYIFDMSGRLVQKQEGITGESAAIDGKALGTGSYYYKLTGGDVPLFGRMLVE